MNFVHAQDYEITKISYTKIIKAEFVWKGTEETHAHVSQDTSISDISS